MSEGYRWLLVHGAYSGLRILLNTKRILTIEETSKEEIANGKKARIFLNEGSELVVAEDFDWIRERLTI